VTKGYKTKGGRVFPANKPPPPHVCPLQIPLPDHCGPLGSS